MSLLPSLPQSPFLTSFKLFFLAPLTEMNMRSVFITFFQFIAGLTTSRSYNSFVHDDPEIGIESSDSDKQGESGVVRGIAIGFAGIALIAIAGFSFAFYRKSRINRYRSQEFLLTDSVFRYDGYSQVDQP